MATPDYGCRPCLQGNAAVTGKDVKPVAGGIDVAGLQPQAHVDVLVGAEGVLGSWTRRQILVWHEDAANDGLVGGIGERQFERRVGLRVAGPIAQRRL